MHIFNFCLKYCLQLLYSGPTEVSSKNALKARKGNHFNQRKIFCPSFFHSYTHIHSHSHSHTHTHTHTLMHHTLTHHTHTSHTHIYHPDFEKSVIPWTEDALVPLCLFCGAPFGIFRRRHHCRLCGTILCDECSKLLPVPAAGWEEGCVCVCVCVCVYVFDLPFRFLVFILFCGLSDEYSNRVFFVLCFGIKYICLNSFEYVFSIISFWFFIVLLHRKTCHQAKTRRHTGPKARARYSTHTSHSGRSAAHLPSLRADAVKVRLFF